MEFRHIRKEDNHGKTQADLGVMPLTPTKVPMITGNNQMLQKGNSAPQEPLENGNAPLAL